MTLLIEFAQTREPVRFYEGDPGNNNCVLGNVNCDPEQMAANDIDLWKTQADDMLPNGDVTVTFNDDVVPPEYTIEVSWEEAGAVTPPTYTIVIPVVIPVLEP